MRDKSKRYTCKICGISCNSRTYRQGHGENCSVFLKKNKNRGTIPGFSKYWINMRTGVIFKNNGKLMKSNINARGNKVVNLINDNGDRIKINIDKKWMDLRVSASEEQDIIDLNRQLTAENKFLKRSISSELDRILLIYFTDICLTTKSRSVLSWTNFIMMSDPTLDRGLVRETINTLSYGIDTKI